MIRSARHKTLYAGTDSCRSKYDTASKCQFGPVRAHVSGIGGLEYGQRPSRLGWLFHERLRWPQPLSLAELSPRDDELLQKVLEWARSYEGKIQRSRSESSKLAHFKHIKLEGFSSHEVVNS